MDGEEFILDPDLVEVVLAEAQENLEAVIAILSGNERTVEMVDALFRCFHSIKGNCAMAQRTDLSSTAHRMETELDIVRKAGRPLTTDEAGLFLELSDLLVLLLSDGDPSVMAPIDRCLEALDKGRAAYIEAPVSSALFSGQDSEDGFSDEAKRSRQQEQNKKTSRLKVDAEMLVATMKVAGELFQLDERLKHIATQSGVRGEFSAEEAELRDGLHQVSREFDGAIEKLYELLLDIQRLPVSQVASPLERVVRDIKRKTGKELEFHVVGRDLRIDKRVLQVLRDPLMHMVRNSADHGVEMPGERRAQGKTLHGTITLEVEELDDVVAVTISDDGAGINLERVKEKAIEQGLIERAEVDTLSVSEVCAFIFHPGFSTAAQVSDLSGRGVGMDVVLQQIRGAGGLITTYTEPGKGTRFRIEVPKAGSPVTDGLAVRTGETVHLIPLKNVVTFVGRREMRVWRQPDNQVLAKVGSEIYPVLRVPGEPEAECLRSARTIGVLLQDRKGNRSVVPVDNVLGRRKALVQKIDKLSSDEFERSEVCILGDGTMAFSLHVDHISMDPSLVWRSESDESLGQGLEGEETAVAS